MPANLALVGIAFLGLVLAALIGSLIGNNEPKQLLIFAAVAFGVLFVVRLYRYVWQISLLLVFISFSLRPTGFAFGPVELSCGLGFALALMFFWQRRQVTVPEILKHRSFDLMQFAMLLWLVYIAVHMFHNFKDPFRPGEFSSTNALKSYFGLAAPFVVLLYCSRNPTGLTIGRNFFWTISRLCFIGLTVNLLVRAYELVTYRGVFIPGLNATSNGYALRTLGPLAMLLAAVALSGPGRRKLTGFQRLTYWALLLGGTVGSLFSGGRVTIIFGFGAVCAALLFRRKVGLLAIVAAIGFLALVAAQFMSGWINSRANPYVQRSLQFVLVEKSGTMLGSLESSTNWRWELATRALAEWQSNPRIFWLGRSTYGYSGEDLRSIEMFGGYEALIRTALRRGTTHNLITDLLVCYGLIGACLYAFMYGSILRFLWVLRRRAGLSEQGSNLVLACVLLAILNLVLELVGAGGARFELIWLSIILIAALYYGPGVGPTAPARVPVRVPIAEPTLGPRRFTRPVPTGVRRLGSA